eukprot:6194938-Pleurochrysis_carterae.AAC.1
MPVCVYVCQILCVPHACTWSPATCGILASASDIGVAAPCAAYRAACALGLRYVLRVRACESERERVHVLGCV